MTDPKVRIEMLKVQARLQEASLSAMALSLVSSSRFIKKTLSKPGTGRIYKVAKPRKSGRNLRARGYHRASLPGQPPAVNTNRLRGSWSVESFGSRGDGFATVQQDAKRTVLRLGSNVVYARILEYGGKTGRGGRTTIKPRPYLRPTLPVIAKTVPKLFAEAIRRRFST